MKKFSVQHLILIFAISVLFHSCNDAIKHQTTKEHVATLVSPSAKSYSDYVISTYCGHDPRMCNNACITVGGIPTHVPCQGYGNLCTLNFTLRVSSDNNNYIGTTLDSTALTNDDFYYFPSRSLLVDWDDNKNEIWLNIPAQIAYRDSVSRQFTLSGLSYTNTPNYPNN